MGAVRPALARMLLAALLGCVLLAPARAADLMWQVRDAGGALRGHLFGTLHLCNAQCFPLSEAVRAAFGESEVLALELDPADTRMGAALAAAGMLERGSRLDAMVPAELRDALAEAIDGAGLDAEIVHTMKPWLASSVLMVGAAANAGFAAHWGVDLWLARAAREQGRRLVVLESVERQIAALSAGGEPAQIESLAQILRLIRDGEVGQFLERVRLAWQRGDELALLELLGEKGNAATLQPLIDDLVNQRNGEMAERIAELMRAEERVFVAIGAAHLGGEHGIVARLGALGFVLCRPPAEAARDCEALAGSG